MATIEVDIEQVEALSREFMTKKSELDSLVQRMHQTVQNTRWNSPAATKFKDQWGQNKGQLDKALGVLEDTSNTARSFATAYRQVEGIA